MLKEKEKTLRARNFLWKADPKSLLYAYFQCFYVLNGCLFHDINCKTTKIAQSVESIGYIATVSLDLRRFCVKFPLFNLNVSWWNSSGFGMIIWNIVADGSLSSSLMYSMVMYSQYWVWVCWNKKFSLWR